MAYSGFGVVVMLGVGLAALLYYVFSQPEESHRPHTHQRPSPDNASVHSNSHKSNGSRHSLNHCAICLEKMDGSSTIQCTTCGNYLHQDCMNLWKAQGSMETRNFCPLCRCPFWKS